MSFLHKTIVPFLKLIRWPNVLMIGVMQVLTFRIISESGYLIPYTAENISALTILIVATMLIAAGGYALNDYFDFDADLVNRPDRPLPNGNFVRFQGAMTWLFASATGLGLVFWLACPTKQWAICTLFVGVVLALFAYSKWLKRLPLIGNLCIAVLAALPLWVIGTYEYEILVPNPDAEVLHSDFWIIGLLFYSGFAFSFTLMRELVKDIEDMPGDIAEGYKTFPVLTGVSVTNNLIIVLMVGLLGVLLFLGIFTIPHFHIYSFLYLSFLLAFSYTFYLIITANKHSHYTRISKWLKALIFVGILSMYFFG